MSHLYVLYEHASGYSLFRVKEFEEIGAFVTQVEQSVLDLSKFNSVVLSLNLDLNALYNIWLFIFEILAILFCKNLIKLYTDPA